MLKMTRVPISFVIAVLLLAPLAGCGGGDDDRDDEQAEEQPLDGSFVGELSGTDALVALVVAPGKDKRELQVYVSDGAKVSEWFQGTVSRNAFTVTSEDGDAEAKGELAGESVKGTVALPGGRSARFDAGRATGAAGLYELTVAAKGTLSGASAAGVGLTSKSQLEAPGNGALKFADGERREFKVAVASGEKPGRLRGGQIRLIVLPDGQMSGAGVRRADAGDAAADFFVRSPK